MAAPSATAPALVLPSRAGAVAVARLLAVGHLLYASHLLGARPLGGRAHGMGAGGSPCGVARAGGFAVGPALATPQGLPTAPNMGGAEGGQCARKAFVPPNYGGEGG